MNQTFERLEKEYLDKGQALTVALTMLEWDNATMAPKASGENTSKMIGVLSELYFNSYMNEDVKKLMKELNAQKDELDLRECAILEELELLYEQLETIPSAEFGEYSELTARATNIWEKAKDAKDFQIFAPTLEKIILFKKKFANYRKKPGSKDSAYDILLNDFEPGFNTEKLDTFFGKMKEELVPFIKQTVEKTKNINKAFNFESYDIEKQKEVSRFFAEYIGFDFEKGIMAESEHPFTTNFHNKDVRITNHFYENNLESAIFSVIHEAGHGLYEMQIDDALTLTLVGQGASMGMHESQSRFFENIIGRSEAFWKPLYEKVTEAFPERLGNISCADFVKAINKPECGLIRTEADELTYSLHILIRYEIEKMIFNDEIEVADIPKVWKDKYIEYLGVCPQNDAEGALQDVHWSDGSFGYFPSYALGSAIGAQIYYYMKKVMPFDRYLEEGNIKPIQEFLKEHIHKFGKTKTTDQILEDMMGEKFNPTYYITYLKEKYENLF